MIIQPQHDHLYDYDHAIAALGNNADSIELKHKAVLALVRSGSLEFALAEYHRYGLDTVSDHEDIMALGGRLYKDLALVNMGASRCRYARQSAQLYEKAYEDSGGYYSGINASTMSLIAGAGAARVQEQVQSILHRLPPPDRQEKEKLYYTEATRAEGYLLLDNKVAAEQSLRRAIEHDPLNYTAHASTLKQFRMILAERGKDAAWLDQFTPPIAVHFAGHMFAISDQTDSARLHLDTKAVRQLEIEIADAIQQHDIGFGFGSLAAGADILIAETLLSEGAELHVVLPVEQEAFVKISVKPFGENWVCRFHKCLDMAHSVSAPLIIRNWPEGALDGYASLIAMGHTVMQARTLATKTKQLLIWDGKVHGHEIGTCRDAENWARTGREQIVIPSPGMRKKIPGKQNDGSAGKPLKVILADGANDKTQTFEDLGRAVSEAIKLQKKHGRSLRFGIDFVLEDDDDNAHHDAGILAGKASPGAVLVSGNVAAMLAVMHENAYKTDYMGQLDNSANGHLRVFNVRDHPG